MLASCEPLDPRGVSSSTWRTFSMADGTSPCCLLCIAGFFLSLWGSPRPFGDVVLFCDSWPSRTSNWPYHFSKNPSPVLVPLLPLSSRLQWTNLHANREWEEACQNQVSVLPFQLTLYLSSTFPLLVVIWQLLFNHNIKYIHGGVRWKNI